MFESEDWHRLFKEIYRVSLKKRSFTRLAPKPLHKALLVVINHKALLVVKERFFRDTLYDFDFLSSFDLKLRLKD